MQSNMFMGGDNDVKSVYKSVLVALLLVLNRCILFSLLTLNVSLSLPYAYRSSFSSIFPQYIFFLRWRQACHLPLQKISGHRNIALIFCLWKLSKLFGNQSLHSIFQNYFKILSTTCFKVGLSPSKKVCFIILNKSPLKKMKKCFLFHIESEFLFLTYLSFCPDFLGHVGKRLDKKSISKFVPSQPG